jgi:carboxyl-terminal processing protease
MSNRSNRGLVSVLAAVLILAVMATSFAAGVSIGTSRQSDKQYAIGGNSVPTNMHQSLDDLLLAYKTLNSDSYWRPFNQSQLLQGAVAGLVDNCCAKDQHTVYLAPAESTYQYQQLNDQLLYGIGASVRQTAGGLQISALGYNSPAVHAGLKQGDVITTVNGKDIRHLSSDKSLALIHGKSGTVVKLLVTRQSSRAPVAVSVTRGAVPTVMYSTNGSIGYIGFTVFSSDAAQGVHGALGLLLNTMHVTSLVIDLRNNLGGYVDQARQIAGEFLPKNDIIWWEKTNLGNNQYKSVANRVLTPGVAEHVPVVVLVNVDTASAAEILAAALQENGRAHVVGTTTYGKGSEQEEKQLPDGSSLRITTTLWLTPKQNQVEGQGIKPDIVVNQPASGIDLQLQRANQYLLTGK